MISNECNKNPQHQLPAVYVYEQNEIPTDCNGNKAGGPQSMCDFFLNQRQKVSTNTGITTPNTTVTILA